MTVTTERSALIVWAVLMGATLASWAIGTHHGHDDTLRQAGTIGVITVAFGKVYLVGTHFMELRRAPALLRLLFGSWVVGVCTTLNVIYLVRG